jgi:hypothetical protein
MYLLHKISDSEYATLDDVYRIRLNPDPWQRPEGPLPPTWLVMRATYDPRYHSTIREVRTFAEARTVIDADMAGAVFQPDKIDNTGRAACRWCDTFRDDMWTVMSVTVGCRLCRTEIDMMREVAQYV